MKINRNYIVLLAIMLAAIFAASVGAQPTIGTRLMVEIDDAVQASADCVTDGCDVRSYESLIGAANVISDNIPAKVSSVVHIGDLRYIIDYKDGTYIVTTPADSTVGFKNVGLLRLRMNAVIRKRIGAQPKQQRRR